MSVSVTRTCPKCGSESPHVGHYYSIGWAYTCEPMNGGRDLSNIMWRFWDLDEVPDDFT